MIWIWLPLSDRANSSVGTDERSPEMLERYIRRNYWTEVYEIYQQERALRTAKITDTGDTVLHIALSKGKEKEAEKMVDLLVSEGNTNVVLGAGNDEENCPLHIAAKMGYVEICRKISNTDTSLIARRNIAGETPLFLAARYGRREAFLWLYYLYMESPRVCSIDIAPWKREDGGDTILHCAIAGGHVDVAIEIIFLYEDHLQEMNMANKNGLFPLHLLAETPSAFESTDLPSQSPVAKFIYHMVFRVEKKKRATTREELQRGERKLRFGDLADAFFTNLGECMVVVRGRDGRPGFINANAMLEFLITYVLSLLVLYPLFLLAGYWFQRIEKLKKKHAWSLQLMEQLLQPASTNEYMLKITQTALPEISNEAGTITVVETPVMVAAQNGVIEVLKNIPESFRRTLNVENDEGKNIILLAAEKKQTNLYQILWEIEILDKSLFGKVDKDGNTALHLAAKHGVNLNRQTATMIEELKWFEFVKNSVPYELREKYNKDGKTAQEIFKESYKEKMISDRQWLNQTSQACSVASTVVASMAFSNIVADNFDRKNYYSLVALSLSLSSTIAFMAILGFRSQSLNFWRYAPMILHAAILTMFGSIVTLWISLMYHIHSLKSYTIIGLPIAICAIVSLPIFIGRTLMSTFNKIPAPSRKVTRAMQYRRPQRKEDDTVLNLQN